MLNINTKENPMPVTYPNEPADYRAARNALLHEEVALRNQSERVAKMRRELPEGGILKQDYVFTGTGGDKVKLSNLFRNDGDTLALYSLMLPHDAKTPCPMCVSLLDGLTGQAKHIEQQIDFAVVSAASPEQLESLAKARGWSGLRLFSAQNTGYQSDYHAESKDGAQLPILNVFRKKPAGISHFWGSESFFADIDGQPRHLDQIWPLWNMLDLTPNGRGDDWYPELAY
jgi:predicted dithiol-disulfide oxidoreductase (DUF899 family)